jgi:allantoinase
VNRLVIRGEKVVLPEGIRAACIQIEDGVITALLPYDGAPPGFETIDAGGLTVMPGVVDTHVHLNDPGRSHWEGFFTGTRAAAAGGVTTLVDMPLNSVPATTSVEGLRAKLKAAEGACWVDVGLWGGVVPGNTGELEPLLSEGVLGFKCFLIHSGVEEFPAVGEAELREAMAVLERNGSVLLAHAESPERITGAVPEGDRRAYETYLASRPPEAEEEAIVLLLRLSRELRARVHIVHLATASAVPRLEAARREGLAVSVETCPHYLTFEASSIAAGATEFKCAPPIRERFHREGLWGALRAGVIDLIATDHSPCPPEMKEPGEFFRAWGGIASLQFGLAAVWTEAKKRGFGLEEVSRWLSSAPARLAGLTGRKGVIAAGADADLIFFDAETSFDWSRPIEHRHQLTPYRGRAMQGVVERTIIRGNTIYERGEFRGTPAGRIVRSGLYELNHGSDDQAGTAFLRCCGSRRWARAMSAGRPYANFAALAAAAEAVANELTDHDWLEAFAAHPLIGGGIGGRSHSSWSKQEQSGMDAAAESTRDELARRNDEYFERFGFIFILCATGKSPGEMLAQLRIRQARSREDEIRAAAGEQRLITRIRLGKLLGQ